MDRKFVSVIIPTYMDWRRLSLCLAALSIQSYPKHRYEIIVVNNNPNDSIPAGFLWAENCKVIIENKTGSYAARNAGLRIAKGEIIGFTDSDCIPDPDWIENAVFYFENNPTCKRIAGNIQIFYKSGKPTSAELYNTLYSFPQKMHVKKSGTSVTGNLFTYRYLFDEVGFFNEKLLSLGDLEWGRYANRAGFKIDYVDNVIIKHPARSLSDLIKKERRIGGGLGVRENGNKLLNFLKLLNENRPRLAEIKFIRENGNRLSGFEKMKVLLIRHYLLSVRATEKVKVQWGKKPNRS